MNFARSTDMPLNQLLDGVEEQLAAVSAAMVAMDPATLEQSSMQLRLVSVQLAQALDGVQGKALPADALRRIRKISDLLAVQRDNLARLSAVADRQAASVLPPSDNASTYGKASGVGNGPGGVARIYRSAG